MTILTLAQQKTATLRTSYQEFPMVQWFVRANRRGVVTAVLLTLLGMGVGVYLIALYLTFQSGFTLRSTTIAHEGVQDSVAKLELKVQERQANLANPQETVLASMEKVTSITYLTPERVAVSTVRLGE